MHDDGPIPNAHLCLYLRDRSLELHIDVNINGECDDANLVSEIINAMLELLPAAFTLQDTGETGSGEIIPTTLQ